MKSTTSPSQSSAQPQWKALKQMEIGSRLRAVRRQKGWTLQQVELESKGRWKAVVVGSYERGDRSLSLKGALEIAELYRIPLAELLGAKDEYSSATKMNSNPILDLRRLLQPKGIPDQLVPIQNFALYLCAQRRDWNGEVLSMRNSDLALMALITSNSESTLLNELRSYRLLLGSISVERDS